MDKGDGEVLAAKLEELVALGGPRAHVGPDAAKPAGDHHKDRRDHRGLDHTGRQVGARTRPTPEHSEVGAGRRTGRQNGGDRQENPAAPGARQARSACRPPDRRAGGGETRVPARPQRSQR